MDRIVVGVDGSEGSAEALRWAVEEAGHREGATVVAVTAWDYLNQPAEEGFDPGFGEEEVRVRLRHHVEDAVGAERAGMVELDVRNDRPARALLDAAKGATMLVVGARGLGGFKGLLLGSVSQQCAHHAPCPVVIVRRRD